MNRFYDDDTITFSAPTTVNSFKMNGQPFAGDYYVSAGVNNFLPDTPQPIRLPLTMTVGVASGGARPAPALKRAPAGSGTSWGVLAALCAAGILIGGAAGLAYRRR